MSNNCQIAAPPAAASEHGKRDACVQQLPDRRHLGIADLLDGQADHVVGFAEFDATAAVPLEKPRPRDADATLLGTSDRTEAVDPNVFAAKPHKVCRLKLAGVTSIRHTRGATAIDTAEQ